MENIDISVIIPTYRRLNMLKEAISSVKKQQSCNVEVIVVDDCSGDDTSTIVETFPDVRYFQNPQNSGPGLSRKFGLSKSRGKYVVFLDDDDYYIDFSFFSKAKKIMDDNPDYNIWAGCAQILDMKTMELRTEEPVITGEFSAIEYLRGFVSEYPVPQTFSIVFRREALKAYGVFEMDMVNHTPMIMRCLQAGKIYVSEDIVGVYRQHDNNISHSITKHFILENLGEKYQMLQIIQSKKLFDDYSQWWETQIKNTVSYYVYGSHPKMKDFFAVSRWCLAKPETSTDTNILMKKYRNYLIDYKICAIKVWIKKKLGVKNG